MLHATAFHRAQHAGQRFLLNVFQQFTGRDAPPAFQVNQLTEIGGEMFAHDGVALFQPFEVIASKGLEFQLVPSLSVLDIITSLEEALRYAMVASAPRRRGPRSHSHRVKPFRRGAGETPAPRR